MLFSFRDCPWCLLAKERLAGLATVLPAAEARVVELEERGREGKELRAAVALATGRTSMPAVFVRGRSLGGRTHSRKP